MRTKSKPLRAPPKTDDWQPNRIRSKAFLAGRAPSPASVNPPRAASRPGRTASAASTQGPRQRTRLTRACKDGCTADSPNRSRRNSAASSGTSHVSTASSPAGLAAVPASSSSSKHATLQGASSSPLEMPPELLRLVHPSSARLGNPTEKPGRGAYRSCDACSRRREKVRSRHRRRARVRA